MFRVIIIPYPNLQQQPEEVPAVSAYGGRMGRNGAYPYAFTTLALAREQGLRFARNYHTGCAMFILDEEKGEIIEEARSPRVPALTWVPKGQQHGDAVAAPVVCTTLATPTPAKSKRTRKRG